MKAIHSKNDNTGKVPVINEAEEYKELTERLSNIEKDIRTFILSILSRHGRISLNLTEKELLDSDNFPVTSTLYGRHDNPQIRITDIYLCGNEIYADGIDSDTDEKRCEFLIYTEQLSDVMYFIGQVLGMN